MATKQETKSEVTRGVEAHLAATNSHTFSVETLRKAIAGEVSLHNFFGNGVAFPHRVTLTTPMAQWIVDSAMTMRTRQFRNNQEARAKALAAKKPAQTLTSAMIEQAEVTYEPSVGLESLLDEGAWEYAKPLLKSAGEPVDKYSPEQRTAAIAKVCGNEKHFEGILSAIDTIVNTPKTPRAKGGEKAEPNLSALD